MNFREARVLCSVLERVLTGTLAEDKRHQYWRPVEQMPWVPGNGDCICWDVKERAAQT